MPHKYSALSSTQPWILCQYPFFSVARVTIPLWRRHGPMFSMPLMWQNWSVHLTNNLPLQLYHVAFRVEISLLRASLHKLVQLILQSHLVSVMWLWITSSTKSSVFGHCTHNGSLRETVSSEVKSGAFTSPVVWCGLVAHFPSAIRKQRKCTQQWECVVHFISTPEIGWRCGGHGTYAQEEGLSANGSGAISICRRHKLLRVQPQYCKEKAVGGCPEESWQCRWVVSWNSNKSHGS